MWSLAEPYPPEGEGLLAGTPHRLLAALGGGALAAALLAPRVALPRAVLRIAGVAAGHGALLGTALAWAIPGAAGRRLAALATALLAAGATGAALDPRGAPAYLGPPLLIAALAARGRLLSLGLGAPVTPMAVATGAAFGAALAGHLLLSASRTLGHRAEIESLERFLAAVAYDVGANVLAAECFFRGALFNRLQRRTSFRVGALVSTACCIVRYLVDPLLPKTVELFLGSLFYMGLLGAGNCWLLWWSGSLLPGLASALLFFVAYRALPVR